MCGSVQLLLLTLVIASAVAHPTTTPTTTTAASTPNTPPPEFPAAPAANVNIVQNETLLFHLKHPELPSDATTGPPPAEIEDLLHGGDFARFDAIRHREVPKDASSVPVPPAIIIPAHKVAPLTGAPDEFPEIDVEWIQNGHDNEDVRLVVQVQPKVEYVRDDVNPHGRGVPLVRGQNAAILAGIFMLLAVVGYIVMLSWRRYLENRYGNREMLVNEDDMNDPSDMKHFSI